VRAGVADRYLKEHATQEIKKRVAAVYILTPDGKTIAGYYTLSQFAIEAGELPPELVQQLHLPKYDKLPVTLLGRLARSKEFKGSGLGNSCSWGALKRALEHSRNIASVAVVVDAHRRTRTCLLQTLWLHRYPESPESALYVHEDCDTDFSGR